MAVIRRDEWTLIVCDCGGVKAVGAIALPHLCRNKGERRVKVVPADQLRGAVSETERLHHVIDEAYVSLRAGRTAEALEYLRIAACHPAGGQ